MSNSNRLLQLLPADSKLSILGLGQQDSQFPSESEFLRWICQKDFLTFCIAVKPGFIPTQFHTYLADKLQAIYEAVRDGKDQRDICEVQPQIGKSTMVSELFPAWILGLQAWPIIVSSYGASLAEQKSQNCRDIVSSQAYQIIFPNVIIDPDTSAKEYWKTIRYEFIGPESPPGTPSQKHRHVTRGSYRAVGVGGGLTGMSGKILIADDPLKDQADADSMTIRESSWKWFNSVLMTRRQSKSGVIVVNTRWHLDDVTGRLLEQQENSEKANLPPSQYDQWERLRFPAFAEDDEYLDGVLFRRKGEVLCPERFTYEDMIKTRNNMDLSQWSALYMQNPILQENAEFKPEWIRYYEPEDLKTLDITWYTLVDLAVSQKQTADNTVVRSVGKDRHTGKLYLGEETAGHLDPLETIDAIFMHQKKYRSRVWVESVGYQAALQTFILEEMRKRSYFFDVNELLRKNTTSKEARIRGLIPYYKAGMIFHQFSDGELEREQLQFPKGKHDDRVDCLSFVLDVADATYRGEVADEVQAFDPHKAFQQI